MTTQNTTTTTTSLLQGLRRVYIEVGFNKRYGTVRKVEGEHAEVRWDDGWTQWVATSRLIKTNIEDLRRR